MPAASRTLKLMVLLPARVAPVQLRLVPLVLAVMSVQVAPPSTEPKSWSPVCNAALRLAVMVWPAVWVMKSLALLPLSLLMRTAETVVSGAVVSST